MKILAITENWPPRIGGIEKYLTGLMGELAKKHEVTVIAPKLKSELHLTGYALRVIRRRFFWPLIKPSWLPLYIYVHRLAEREKFDLIICGKGLFEGLLAQQVKKRLGIPYVICTYYMEINEWDKRASTRRKLTRVLKSANKVIIIAEALKNKIQSFGVSAQDIIKIHPAVSEEFLKRIASNHSDKVLKKYNVKKPYILSVARLIPRKGLSELISAYAKLEQMTFGDVQLVIVGDGPQRQELERLAGNEYVQPMFLGEVPEEDLPALYANAELFALTPKEIDGDIEGFGIVYLEAGAAGIPVIGTTTGGVPEAVQENVTGLLVEPGNVDAIAKAMTELLGNPELCQRLGDAGKKRVQGMFTWKEQAASLLSVHKGK